MLPDELLNQKVTALSLEPGSDLSISEQSLVLPLPSDPRLRAGLLGLLATATLPGFWRDTEDVSGEDVRAFCAEIIHAAFTAIP
jgi:hypothetical protein